MRAPEILGGVAPLTLEAVDRIAAGAPVVLDTTARERLVRSHRQLATLVAAGRVVYGLNTGCGPLCDRPVSPEDGARFQLNLVRSHATGVGAPHPTEVVRATMAVRAQTLAQGRSAVRPAVVEQLVVASPVVEQDRRGGIQVSKVPQQVDHALLAVVDQTCKHIPEF